MKIYFLRHTSLDVTPDIFYGQTDLDVSASFEVDIIPSAISDAVSGTGVGCFPIKPI